MEAADLASRRVKEAATGEGAQTVKEAATGDPGAKGEGGSGRSLGLPYPVVPNHLETGSGAKDFRATTTDAQGRRSGRRSLGTKKIRQRSPASGRGGRGGAVATNGSGAVARCRPTVGGEAAEARRRQRSPPTMGRPPPMPPAAPPSPPAPAPPLAPSGLGASEGDSHEAGSAGRRSWEEGRGGRRFGEGWAERERR
uniref:Uncharacterized protein n=1 Tax=Oryza barthii TaxID=65489 RepID=A0A0D3ELW6_9ORYZ